LVRNKTDRSLFDLRKFNNASIRTPWYTAKSRHHIHPTG